MAYLLETTTKTWPGETRSPARRLVFRKLESTSRRIPEEIRNLSGNRHGQDDSGHVTSRKRSVATCTSDAGIDRGGGRRKNMSVCIGRPVIFGTRRFYVRLDELSRLIRILQGVPISQFIRLFASSDVGVSLAHTGAGAGPVSSGDVARFVGSVAGATGLRFVMRRFSGRNMQPIHDAQRFSYHSPLYLAPLRPR